MPILITENVRPLCSLGIPTSTIPSSLSEQEERVLHRKIRPLMHYFSPALQVTDLWQLLALLGKTDKQWLDKSDNLGANCTHYAAWSGSAEALAWVKDNYPDLMTTTGNNGATIAHYAAWSGSTEALAWVQKNYPDLMTAKNKLGLTIAHYAAWSGSADALAWVPKNHPGLMTAKNKLGLTIAHFALDLGSSHQFNKALLLSGSPEHFDFVEGFTTLERLRTFQLALADNYSLTSVTFKEDNIPQDIQTATAQCCSRNPTLLEIAVEFKVLLQGYYQQGEGDLLRQLPKDILLFVFSQRCQGLGISEQKIRSVFESLYQRSSPDKRFFLKKQNFADKLKNHKDALEHEFRWFGLKKSPQEKINVLNALINTLEDKNSPNSQTAMHGVLTDFVNKNALSIDAHRNPFLFFGSASLTRTRVLIDKGVLALGN